MSHGEEAFTVGSSDGSSEETLPCILDCFNERKKSHGINPVTKGHYLFKLLIPCSPVESREGHHGTFLHCLIDGIRDYGTTGSTRGIDP